MNRELCRENWGLISPQKELEPRATSSELLDTSLSTCQTLALIESELLADFLGTVAGGRKQVI